MYSDTEMQELIDSWTKPIDEQLSSKVGYLRVPLYRKKATPLEIETTAGNFITDALLNYVRCQLSTLISIVRKIAFQKVDIEKSFSERTTRGRKKPSQLDHCSDGIF